MKQHKRKVIGPDKIWTADDDNEVMIARGIENEHDAALIVQAVNEYEALNEVAGALRELREWCVCEYQSRQMPNGCALESILTQADQALSTLNALRK